MLPSRPGAFPAHAAGAVVLLAGLDTRIHGERGPLGAARLLDALPGAIAAMSEPMVSYDNVGFYLLSREVAKHVKVVQSGQGADEVFAGYFWYPQMDAEGGTDRRQQANHP